MKKPQDKKQIIIVAYWHDRRLRKKTGGLIRMFELADNLLELGHSVTMVLPRLGNPQLQTSARVVQIPFLDLSIFRPLSFHLLSTAWLFLAVRNSDLVYVRQMNSFLPLLIAKMVGVRSCFEIPNDPYLGYSSLGKSKEWLVRMIDRLSISLADWNVVLSEWSRGRLHAIGSVPLDRILIFPSGTDTELFRPMDKKEACEKLGFDPSAKYVGFVGTFFEHQGIDTLVEAAPCVLTQIPDAKFLLVGDGPMRSAWEKKVRERGLQDAFHFTGQVPYPEVPLYIGAMDLCVAPHLADTNQASPVKLFDYMAAGRPIVASDIEVVREILGESGCARIVPPGDAPALGESIVSILSNPALQSAMGGRGRKHVQERFDRKHLTASLFCGEVWK